MSLFRLLIVALTVMTTSFAVAADDQPRLQEEVWALPLPLPTIAYVVRPVGDGPFPLAIMNHGVSLDPVQRSFFPLVEFRDAAMWFARRGYMVVAPSGSYGAAAVEVAEAGLFSGAFFSKVTSHYGQSLRGRVRGARSARGPQHQVWRLAETLLQAGRRQDDLPHHHQRRV